MSKYLIEVKKKKNFYHKNGQIKIFQDVDLKIKAGELLPSLVHQVQANHLFCIYFLF